MRELLIQHSFMRSQCFELLIGAYDARAGTFGIAPTLWLLTS